MLDFCWKNHQRFCPRCKCREFYRLTDGRRRCKRCLYSFHDFSRRFLNRGAFSCQQWLWFLKFFALEIPLASIATEMDISYATVLKAADTVRRAILAQALDAEKIYAAGIWPGPGNPLPDKKIFDVPVFGIIEVENMAICDLMPNLQAEHLLHYKLNFYLKTASVGQIVYTAPYRHYQALISCGPGLWPMPHIQHKDRRLPIEGTAFWSVTKRRFQQLRGISASHFALYLKEFELRYNAHGQDLFAILAQAMCAFVPRLVLEKRSSVD
ncbi:MAG: IS1595 family transposase [Desulfovibrionales bacterium]|nr:IS1595 family transposase [Desulfovibrionales bacterium]